jgi:hypothetical protein
MGGKNRGRGVNRLLDIVVEEVSLVDRAANKHRFLIVKRSDEMDETTTNPTAPADDPSAQSNPATAGDSTATGESSSPEGAGATDGGQDESSLAVALAALEGITEAVELLDNMDEDQARGRLGELAGELRSASERLAEAAGAGSAGTGGAGEQEGSDPSKDAPDLSTIVDAVRATLQRVDALIHEPPADGASSATDDRANDAAGGSGLGEQLTELVGELRSLTATVKEQQQRLARLEKRFGLPNSAPSGERPAKPEEEDVGWPMDLNRPFDRESVDKATSFHDV